MYAGFFGEDTRHDNFIFESGRGEYDGVALVGFHYQDRTVFILHFTDNGAI